MSETTQKIPVYVHLFVAAALSFVWWMAYNHEYPNEPLEHAPKNIQYGKSTGPVPTTELHGLTRFVLVRDSVSLKFQQPGRKQWTYLFVPCWNDIKNVPHKWKQSRQTTLRVLEGTHRVVSIYNHEQNIQYEFDLACPPPKKIEKKKGPHDDMVERWQSSQK